MLNKFFLALLVLSSLALHGCVTHVHRDASSWSAYKKAHPNARFVVVNKRPAPERTCWKIRRGWRCVTR